MRNKYAYNCNLCKHLDTKICDGCSIMLMRVLGADNFACHISFRKNLKYEDKKMETS